MLTKDKILDLARQKGKIFTRDMVVRHKVSRQYANSLIADLVAQRKLLKLGSTRKAFYVLPEYARKHPGLLPLKYQKTYANEALEEHKVLDQIERTFPPIKELQFSAPPPLASNLILIFSPGTISV